MVVDHRNLSLFKEEGLKNFVLNGKDSMKMLSLQEYPQYRMNN